MGGCIHEADCVSLTWLYILHGRFGTTSRDSRVELGMSYHGLAACYTHLQDDTQVRGEASSLAYISCGFY